MNKLKVLSALLMMLMLSACGGDGSFVDGGGDGGGAGDTLPSCADEPTNPDCVPVIPPTTFSVLMGNGTGVGFTPEIIEVGLASISAGGSTAVEVTLVHDDDTSILYTDAFVDVTFSSTCTQQGLADITPVPVTTNSGIAQATYTAGGCVGDDVISANAVVQGVSVTALGSITVAAAGVNSIGFISANPTTIGLQGTGGLGFDETSDVVFQVVDDVGLPVPGVDVDFALDSSVGGISLSPATDTSDANGFVQTVVTAGTVAVTVRVSATVVGSVPTVATQSSNLVVSTGLPDQDSFSWAVTCPNIEAWGYDGVENDITVKLSDRFNNPVPDGTAVSFTAEGGSVEPSCTTMSDDTQQGFCVVTWSSASPRPADGRVTILAHAIGEESFNDFNGNGVFDVDDVAWGDIPEIYRDDDESGTYDGLVDGFFLDFNNSSSYDGVDGEFNGILCQDPARCEGPELTGIGASGVITMSGGAASISDDVGGELDISSGFGTVTFTIGDLHNQPLPAGTTVAFETANGDIIGPDSYVTPCTFFDGPLDYQFAVNKSDDIADSKTAVLTVESPGPGDGTPGIITTYFLNVSD